MHQFGVYRNRNKATSGAYPLLLNLQSDLIDETGTRVVVPLVSTTKPRPPAIASLAPILTVGGKPHVLLMPLLAAIELADLGAEVEDASHQRATILAALDLLVSGI